ncbi:MAG: DUF5946 family protein [Acidobacteriaceae bacterium]
MPTTPTTPALETCLDCKLQLPFVDTPTHTYLGASSSCWALYNQVLAREYSTPALMLSVHRLTVDAYAAQHPGQPERRTIQSIWVHLTALYLTIERGLANDYATRVIGVLTTNPTHLEWLPPPPTLGPLTVIEVANADTTTAHEAAVRRWAASVWQAWSPYHQPIAAKVSALI